jgi:hypothetical protein
MHENRGSSPVSAWKETEVPLGGNPLVPLHLGQPFDESSAGDTFRIVTNTRTQNVG